MAFRDQSATVPAGLESAQTSLAEAFEADVLASLGLDASDEAIVRWSRIYQAVSERMTVEAEVDGLAEPTALMKLPASRGWSERDVAAVWGLIYASRTYQVAHRLLGEYPASPGRIIEIGAGWGPFALAAAGLGFATECELYDLSTERLACAERLFAARGLRAPLLHVEDASTARLRGASAIAVPYSLGEIGGESAPETRGVQLIERWLSVLEPGGLLYVVEPGSRRSSRRLQTVRDALAGRAAILGPCCGAVTCPLLVRDTDWCHFTWKLRLGPVAQRVADRARRRWQEAHCSWLVLGNRDDPALAGDGSGGDQERRGRRATGEMPMTTEGIVPTRVLELRASGRGKLMARLCTPAGEETLTVLRKNDEAFERMAGLEPGERLGVDPRLVSRRGDGLRVEDANALRIQR